MLTRREALERMAAVLAAGGAVAGAQAGSAAQPAGTYMPTLLGLGRHDPTSGELLAQALAVVGADVAALSAWEGHFPEEYQTAAGDEASDRFRASDAITTITAAARRSRVVILNEAHHISESRGFLADLLVALRPLGFANFYAESFINDAAGSQRMAALRVGSSIEPTLGGYCCDPAFAEAIRTGLRLGYRLHSYERDRSPGTHDAQDRELAQAQHLAAALHDNPNSRLFIYCGFDHGAKGSPAGIRRMASWLQSLTGIEPLSIEQARNFPASSPTTDAPHVAAVLRRFNPTSPICVFKNDAAYVRSDRAGFYDLSVFHPRLARQQGRPGWLTQGGRRTSVSVPFAPLEEESIIQARYVSELPSSVPADQVLVPQNSTAVTLCLRAGTYHLSREMPDGERRPFAEPLVVG